MLSPEDLTMRSIQIDPTTTGFSRGARRLRPLLAVAAALALSAAPALANTPSPAQDPANRPPPPNRISMDFRIVEGTGTFGQRRWIQASGPILLETADRFDQFARANRIAGMTIVLDSPGGSMTAGLRMGRAFRAAGVNTMVGRTVVRVENGRTIATLINHGVGCASACTYAFLGGVQRIVPTTARFGVHQFSRSIGRDGRFESETPTMRDFVAAQRRMAELAVYIQEMGVDARLLELAASMPYGGQLKTLTPAEIGNLRIATPAAVNEADRGSIGWSANPRPDSPMLFRRTVRPADGGQRIDEEVALTCHREAGRAVLHYRAIIARASEGFSLQFPALRIDVGGEQVAWRAPAAPAQARGTNGSVWLSTEIPRAALEEAGRRGALALERPPGATPEGRSEFGDGLGAQLSGFLAACDTLRANMTSAAR
jgi:hypothetical protein